MAFVYRPGKVIMTPASAPDRQSYILKLRFRMPKISAADWRNNVVLESACVNMHALRLPNRSSKSGLALLLLLAEENICQFLLKMSFLRQSLEQSLCPNEDRSTDSISASTSGTGSTYLRPYKGN